MLEVYDTLTRKKGEFRPIHGNRVSMFVCGPTVYDLSHIGHARTYLAYDIIARYIKFKGFSLFYLMNITDVDDKIIEKAKERDMGPLVLANEHTREFYKDLELLGINSINLFAKASEYIKEIISHIGELIHKGFAYPVDGNVYFDISKFEDYGKLSHQADNEIKKHRIEPDPKKKGSCDFSLWKNRKEGEIAWDSPWGKGRPGWHIEDTAISLTHFGSNYDIHGGAIELIFPHHEAEIAQAESMTGKKPFVKYWIHTGTVNVDGRKMSKSLGNFITIKEITQKYAPDVLRLFFAQSHYRSNIDFRKENLEKAKETLDSLSRIYEKINNLLNAAPEESESEDDGVLEKIKEQEQDFYLAMDNDFNTPLAISSLISLGKELDKRITRNTSRKTLQVALDAFNRLNSIIGLFQGSSHKKSEKKNLDELVQVIIDLREYFRKKKEWDASDEIRDQLKKLGIMVEDFPEDPE